jgi:phage recombination protein Bet
LTELVEQKQSPVPHFSKEKLEYLRKYYAKDATDLEFEHYIGVCKFRRLNPEARHIYFMKVRDKPTIILSIEANRLIAQRTGAYAGCETSDLTMGADGKPICCTVTVKRFVQGQICEFKATAFYKEQYRERVPIWNEMPTTMLEKCAEAKALRRAFPEELSEFYTDDEMQEPIRLDPVEGRPAASAFDSTNPKQLSWLHQQLLDQKVPKAEWSLIAAELNGHPADAFKTKFVSLVAKAKEGKPA